METTIPYHCVAYLTIAKEFYSAVIAWPVLPLLIWFLGIRAGRRARLPDYGIGTELLAFGLRVIGAGVLLSPIVVGNGYIGFPLPSAWIVAWSLLHGPAVSPEDHTAIEFASASLRCCLGISFGIHFLFGWFGGNNSPKQ